MVPPRASCVPAGGLWLTIVSARWPAPAVRLTNAIRSPRPERVVTELSRSRPATLGTVTLGAGPAMVLRTVAPCFWLERAGGRSARHGLAGREEARRSV